MLIMICNNTVKPEFTSSNMTTSFDVVEGSDDFEIHLPAKGNPPQIHYFWFKNGISLTSNKRMSMTGPTMLIRQVSRDDHGVYSIRAANTEGSSNTSFLLNVLCEFIFLVLILTKELLRLSSLYFTVTPYCNHS